MKAKYQNILFTDIETVPKAQHFFDLDEQDQKLFIKKFDKETIEYGPKKVWEDRAALYAEFCKIVSVGFGYFTPASKETPDDIEFRVKTIVMKDELTLLYEATRVMASSAFIKICGHNFNNFDGPILCRRMVINNLTIPYLLDPTDRKPYELSWLDTMKIWGFSEWNYKCSLDRLCHVLGVPSPKQDMDGSQVKDYFYGATPGKEDLPFGKFDKESERFAAIGKYQAGDIVALANVFLRLKNEHLIPEHKIRYV